MASEKDIDRQATCPFLLKFCYRSNGYHPSPTSRSPVTTLPAHLQIYTWQSCTLHELAQLLTSALPNILPDPAIGTRLSFRLVYPDTRPPPGGGRLDDGARGRYMSKEMGSIVVSPQEEGHTNGNGEAAGLNLDGEDAEKTLADARFVIGDFVDCAVFPPLSDGSTAPRTGMGMRGRGPPRENGYRGGRGSIDRGGGGMRAFGVEEVMALEQTFPVENGGEVRDCLMAGIEVEEPVVASAEEGEEEEEAFEEVKMDMLWHSASNHLYYEQLPYLDWKFQKGIRGKDKKQRSGEIRCCRVSLKSPGMTLEGSLWTA